MTQPQPLNILHLIATNFVGGPEKQIIKHLEYVDSARYNLAVASYIEKNQPNEFIETLRKNRRTVFEINHSFLLDLSIIDELKKILTQNKIDILITHGYKSNIIGYYASRSLGLPQAMYVRGWTMENIKIKIYNMLEKRYLKKADLMVTVAENKRKELLGADFNPDKLRCITNAVELDESKTELTENIREKYSVPQDTPLILAAGRLSPEKGHKDMILALKKIADDQIDFKAVIFGEGQLTEQLSELIKKMHLTDKIILAGFSRNWKQYLPQADLLINPSLSEVMPNVVLEAMASRCPVLATEVGGVNELITDGKSGFLAQPNNPDSIYNGIKTWLSQKENIPALIEAGYNHIRDNFSFSSQAEKLSALYDELYAIKTKKENP